MRRNYVRDRTQAALTYISEYETAQKWENDPQYDGRQVQQRLQIIYGKADQVKQRIDAALNNDDIHRRRRTMRILGLLKRFPQPQNMKDSPVTTWITWVRDESNELIAAIDEEVTKRQDPDDPFLMAQQVGSSYHYGMKRKFLDNHKFNRSTNRIIATRKREDHLKVDW